MPVRNSIHINVSFGLVMGKIYTHENDLIVTLIDNDNIYPFSGNVKCAAQYLMEKIGGWEVELKVMHPSTTSRKKKNKIRELIKETELDERLMVKYLLLLI